MGSNSENNPDLRNLKRNLLYAILQHGNVAADAFHLNSGTCRARWILMVLAVLNLSCPRVSGEYKKCNYVPTDLITVLLLSLWPCSLNQAFT